MRLVNDDIAVLPQILANGRFLPYRDRMAASDDGVDPGSQLAREAQPLRYSLTRYFTRRMRDRSEVEDLVQEVFARIVARDSSNPIDHLGSYVYQTARSVLADHSRRRSARRQEHHVPFDPDVHGDADHGADEILIGRESLHQATAALLSLPERTRTIFILRRLDGVRSKDVASQLGISVSAVEKHMIRAVRHLAALRESAR